MAGNNVKFQVSELNKLVANENSCVTKRENCSRRLLLLPIHLADIKESVKQCLSLEVTTYDEGLNGIILSFKNVYVQSLAEDDPGSPYIPVDYIADVYIFKPKIGGVLTGVVSKKSNDHIGCLAHKIFNVTIPRPQNIPVKEWVGNTLNIGDEVTFKIVFVDLIGQLPFIKGMLLSESKVYMKKTEEIFQNNI